MSSWRNHLYIMLTALLVFNASCACASMVVQADPHAHHQQTSTSTPTTTDCLQADCTGVFERAVGAVAERDAGQLPSVKFDLDDDDDDGSSAAVIAHRLRNVVGNTGPPSGSASSATDTPVQRYDLQLK
jgi:hypothetical protein